MLAPSLREVMAPGLPGERVELRLGAHLGQDALKPRLGLGVDVRHRARDRRVDLGDQAVHLVRDGAVGRVALAPRAQLDELHRLARVEVEDVADAEAEAQRVRRLALATLAREALPLGGRDLVGARANRRHRPGRGFEALRYRFEIVSDYGAFRDLQRHRMLTVQWQALTPDLGAGVPDELVAAGLGDDYARALEASAAEYHRLVDDGLADAAPYALCLGFRIRYVLDLNAREAMHLIELRSGREGHPTYRAVAHEMHRLIGEVHPAVAAAMTHVDHEREPRLERLLSEMRTEARLDALARSAG